MSKELFLKNKQLANEWRKVTSSETFDNVLTYARAEIVQSAPTREELRGVEMLAHTLRTLAESDDTPFVFPSPGLNHMPDKVPDRQTEPKTRKNR